MEGMKGGGKSRERTSRKKGDIIFRKENADKRKNTQTGSFQRGKPRKREEFVASWYGNGMGV